MPLPVAVAVLYLRLWGLEHVEVKIKVNSYLLVPLFLVRKKMRHGYSGY